MSPRTFARLDELSVRVAYGEYPGEPPSEVFLLLLHDPDLLDQPLDDDQLVADLMALVSDENVPGNHELPHDLSVRKAHLSWGADAAAVEVLLYIAQQVGNVAIGEAVLATFRKILQRVQSTSSESFNLSTDEVKECGEWSVRSAFRDWLDDDAPLELVEEEREEASWTGVFRDHAGSRYRVVLAAENGDPRRVHVSRTAARA